MSVLAEKKRKMEQEEAERNMQILLDFLHCLRKQKVDELNEVGPDRFRTSYSWCSHFHLYCFPPYFLVDLDRLLRNMEISEIYSITIEIYLL